ncbi:MAG: hypothetical protein M0Q91_10155 [Methanoregula sp.]|jgi:hypothetical protein|nr:hypothetical protein [Methanoregula sp.]
MNFLLTFDCSNGSARQMHYARYDTEKERMKLMKQVEGDAKNNPAAQIWIADATGDGIVAQPLGE